ncbi:MAG: acyl carrier protein [Flavobacteriales bacterium]|nr:acyl carrier protein [Flavobacteriales bacterium]
MTKTPRSPRDIIAELLKVDANTLSDESGMGVHASWDSLNHVAIIGVLEREYGVVLQDDEIMLYTTMKAINERFK